VVFVFWEEMMVAKGYLDELCINTIRTLSMDAVEKANSGHPGTPMALAPVAYVLWTRFLRYNPENPHWPDRDRFVLSAGHASMLLYSLQHLAGYDITLDDIRDFRQWGSKTPGHPEHCPSRGVETTTGPLGQGFGNGIGMAMAERYLAARFNQPGYEIVDHYVYGLCSDGDLMEGVASEAASLAGHLGLSKVVYFYDDNRITIEGKTDLAFSEDVAKRFDAYGWQVQKVEDGNDLGAIAAAVEGAQNDTKRPSLIILRTHIAYGSPNKQDTAAAHGAPLGADEVRLTKNNLGWSPDKAFFVPKEALLHFRNAVEKRKQKEVEWQASFAAFKKTFQDLAAEWERVMNGDLAAGWDDTIPEFMPHEGAMATRVASGRVLNAIACRLPELLGGSADLAPSTNTYIAHSGDFERENYGNRNLHFGVREHAMGGVVSGLALHGGIRPFAATFLVFSDYMRPSIRLAALMKLPVIYVFTHDSIGLGEDGPTHQPIEHLASLRAIPCLTTIRPADANETAVAWRIAMESRNGPVCLILTRQGVPILDRSIFPSPLELRRGAYVLGQEKTKLEAILMASGSEVHVALEAWERLSDQGLGVRLVNTPSWELFEAQNQAYKDTVLPKGVKARLAVEAASPMGWERYIGLEGDVIGVPGFGASAPGKVVMKNYGFAADNIVNHIRRLTGSH
jgi:transketolase